MSSGFKSNDFKQPKFGILRPIGDLEQNSSKEEQTIKLSERDKKIQALKDLWKLDEYIHQEETFIERTPAELKKLSKKDQAAYHEAKQSYMNQLQMKDALFKKQNYNCYFCGFHDEKFLEKHHVNGDHSDNSESNVVGACTLCHRQHHLLWVSLHQHANLGLFQENSITQSELNHLQRIAIVLEHHPNIEIRGRFGLTGKLGLAIKDAVNSFSRPTPFHLISNDDKENFFLSRYPRYKNFDYLNPAEVDQSLPDEARDKQIKAAQEKYDEHKAMAINEQRKGIKESTNFSVFELALALRNLSWKDYESFEPKHLRLCFSKHIFTPEQIAYYLTLPHFDPETWQYLNNNFKQSDA